MNSSEPLEVDLQVLCSLDKTRIEAFAALLWEMVSLLGADSIASLKKVIIVDDLQVPTTVNKIIQTIEPSASYQPSSTYSANAVAVPLEKAGVLACFIVMGKSFLEPLDMENYHHPDTVSALLEELLQVWVYTSAWRRRSYVQQRNKELSACDVDILTIASKMCDEYVVIRRKSQLAGSPPLFGPEPDKGFVGGKLNYGGDVLREVSQGIVEIENTIVEAASGRKEISDTWNDLTRALYRSVFEQLSRSAAYCDGTPEETLLEMKLQSFKFYHDLLAEYWHTIHDGLKRVFDSNLDETESVLNEISDSIRALLKTIGVVYRKMEDGQCWVDFTSAFFDTWQ